MTKWDLRFLEMARLVSTWSKDPSTKAGAVIVDKNRRIVSVGFNGFAKGVMDDVARYENRDLKYKMIVHAERNAIVFAQRSLQGCTLYTFPFMPCSVCSSMVIQSGVARCVAPPIPEHLKERWAEDMALAAQMFQEAGVKLDILEVECLDGFGMGSMNLPDDFSRRGQQGSTVKLCARHCLVTLYTSAISAFYRLANHLAVWWSW